MKLKILQIFTDKYTDKKYKINEIVDFEEKRAAELLSDKRNLVEEVKELVKDKVEEVKEEVEEAKPKRKTSKK